MAVRSVILALAALLAFSAPARSQECVPVSEFADIVRETGAIVMLAKAEAVQRAARVVNINRANAGKKPIDVGNFMVMLLQDPDGTISVGVAMFDKQNCAIAETVVILTADQWLGFAQDAKLVKEDFAVIQGS